MKNFDLYAEYYDLIYKDKNYQQEIEYISSLIPDYLRSESNDEVSILDMGCGTGKHSTYLAEKGFNVHGIDYSSSMIEIANANKETLNKKTQGKLSYEVGDVTTFRCDRKFDLVISLFHVMSYQNSNKAVSNAFKTAKRHVKEGGLFIFDFWYGQGVLNDPPVVRVKRLENDRHRFVRIAEPVPHSKRNVIDVNYEIISLDKVEKTYTMLNEKHPMRYFFQPELDLFGTQAGFKKIECYEWLSKIAPTEKSWNAILVLKSI